MLEIFVMRIVFSWFLVIATLASIMAGDDDVCLVSHESQIIASGVSTSHSSRTSSTGNHHEGFPCHSCHLGHCAFVVPHTSIGMRTSVDKIMHPDYVSTLPSDYLSSLLRPPIA